MKAMTKASFLLFIYCAALFAGNEPNEKVLIYNGTSDASAAVAIGEDMFIVADDENNILRVYKTSYGSRPVFSCDLTEFLDIEPQHPEADIEGATMLGDRIYWITSHGRNKDGKMRPNRYRFFATSVKIQNHKVVIRPVGVPCRNLIHTLIKTEPLRRLGLDNSTRFYATNLTKLERENLAPKRNGLNIEGLCASPDGTIYMGFRNPRPVNKANSNKKALVVPLNNARQVIEKQAPPVFGEPILWDLAGLGIRSMEYSHFHKAYFIIAGPHNERSGFVLYRWSSDRNTPPKMVRKIELDNFTPEALITFRNSPGLFLLSDDGSLIIDVSDASECTEGRLTEDRKCPNKYLTDPNKKHFRGIWLEP